ncbi:unnamed protein product [Adineta ricciae]|uniref:Uncharacterized protein n=1 Tax=Adineta ricciae TaxID=249248 RepID=A0A815NMS0_ADIRI|nr:unnamed protein product [Adineta ricciae]CAF1488634.1 unnamed protein product [Adineta ricciae]
MGGCCSVCTPTDKFVGTWSNGTTTRLEIPRNGCLLYRHIGTCTRSVWSMPGCYNENGFCTCMCGCVLRGKYVDESEGGPGFMINDELLKKSANTGNAIWLATGH